VSATPCYKQAAAGNKLEKFIFKTYGTPVKWLCLHDHLTGGSVSHTTGNKLDTISKSIWGANILRLNKAIFLCLFFSITGKIFASFFLKTVDNFF
jgi:hypothetical protein